jgi:hypothetical protein
MKEEVAPLKTKLSISIYSSPQTGARPIVIFGIFISMLETVIPEVSYARLISKTIPIPDIATMFMVIAHEE